MNKLKPNTKSIKVERKVFVLLTAVIIFVLASGYFVNNSLQSIVDELSEESPFSQNIIHLKELTNEIAEAEKDVKSYGLTNNYHYLDAYNHSITSINQTIDTLYENQSQNQEWLESVPKIDSLVQLKFSVLDELLFVQSQSSSAEIFTKITATLDESEDQLNENNEADLISTGEDKEGFIKRLFGKRKKNKETADVSTSESTETSENSTLAFEKINAEINALKKEKEAFELQLKLKELSLIEEDKRIMDEITNVIQSLESAEQRAQQERLEFVKSQKSSTHWHIILFCLLSVLFLSVAGYIIYYYVKRNRIIQKKLRKAKVETELRNTEITDSINYAQRIQNAILPTDERLKTFFPNSFVLYLPKDIVAGDFYWLRETEEDIFFAVADCTGHGVPGAMVSVACSAALTRCINEFKLRQPSQILDKAKELVVETFDEGHHTVYDGMDITLIKQKKGSLQIEFAGAHNSLIMIREGFMKEIKADKQPVARFYKNEPFTNHELDVKKGDLLYLFSDGFQDQFGGPKRKKFMYKKFKTLLTETSDFGPEEQYNALLDAFNDWKSGIEQLDDVTVVGLQIS